MFCSGREVKQGALSSSSLARLPLEFITGSTAFEHAKLNLDCMFNMQLMSFE